MNPDEVWIVVGLGNPGPEYANTYHNVGFRVLERLAGRHGARIDLSCGPASISRLFRVGGRQVVLVLPQTFMNLSGSVLPRLFTRFETSRSSLIVVYDDVALPLGRMRIRQKGSAGGHNGVKSIISACASDEFLRLRVGILPDRPMNVLRDFVLSKVAKSDREIMESSENEAVAAIEALLSEDVDKVMATFNGMDLRASKEKS